jgi:hypothetical protein
VRLGLEEGNMVKFTKGKYEFREGASINAMFKGRSMHIAWDVA